jgi:4'-phosphopantetheinyl transferase
MIQAASATRLRVGLRFCRIEPDAVRLAAAQRLLTPGESARAGRFRRDHDRFEYILARAVLRRLLGRKLACNPTELVFGSSPAGKPVLLYPETDVCFSLSHCRGGLLVGWCAGREVGVDLEWMDPARVSLSAVRRVFSPGQVRCFERADDSERTRLFYRYWTRLEAASKTTGEGVAGFRTRPSSLKVRSFRPAPGFTGAAAFIIDG